jgi:hypothetical protein
VIRSLPLSLLVACAPAVPSEPVDLVAPAAWTALDPDDDPLIDERPVADDCSALASTVEDGGVEIRTDACAWVTLGQPLLADVHPTDTLDLLFFHNALAAPPDAIDPAARVELWIGDAPAWELRVPIPHEAGLHALELEPGLSALEGEPVVLHVSNHGQNSYRLTHLQRLPP